MPPTDNMPDFDSMSPEELMAWMETLAERQGATEGFTTESRVDIAEVDPTTMQDTGPGYIPYGMSEEQWAKKQEEEAAKKAARQAERQAQQPAPPPAPTPVAQPEPEPTPAVASSGEMPDFDSMSPEELMAWMETLAERQGATEGFTTESRVDIAEVDPTTMQDTGPGYIPYGMSEEQWAKKQEEEAAKKAARQAERQAQQPTPPPAPTPVAQPEPETEQEEFEMPDFELPQLDMEAEMTTQATSTGLDWLEDLAADQGADFPEMDLSGLGDDLAGELDLSALSGVEDTQSSDPMSWLDGLAQGDEQPGIDLSFDDEHEEAEEVEETSFAIDFDEDEDEEDLDLEPASIGDFGDGDEDPLNWLESLAREQGADPSEFTTKADFAVGDTESELETPGFAFDSDDSGFSLDDIDELDAIDLEDEADPVAWLEGLASQQSASEHDEDAAVSEGNTPFADDPLVQSAKSGDVMQKLQAGDVSSDDMRGWMDNLLSQGIDRSDDQGFKIPEPEIEDVDAELESNIPDWLVDQVGPPPEALNTDTVAAFTDAAEPEAVQDVPDWLQENVGGDVDEGLAQIFDTEVEDVEFDFQVDDDSEEVEAHYDDDMTLEETLIMGDEAIDTNDPWVEAFELERTGSTPDFVAEAAQSAASILEEVTLPPETSLAQGEPIPVPDWLGGDDSTQDETPAPVTSAPAVVAEMEAISMDDADLPDWLREMETQEEMEAIEGEALPDWLREAGVEADAQVPDWLRDTVDEEEVAVSVEPETAPTVVQTPPAPQAAPPQPVQQPAAVVPVASPAPVMVSMDAEEAAALLESARSKVRAGQVDAGIDDYESVIRANAQLDNVVNDLSKMVKEGLHKSNPVAHRVLGDGLMRLGRLQEALDTYRKALNLL